jgi:hypothetical protein
MTQHLRNPNPRLFTDETYPAAAIDGDFWWPIGCPLRVKQGPHWLIVGVALERVRRMRLA